MYLLDTDILVDHLRGHRSLVSIAQEFPCSLSDFRISIISVVELYAGVRDNEGAYTNLERVLSAIARVPLEMDTAKFAGQIRKEHRAGLGDAVIAATARVEGLTLITRNVRHFASIAELSVREPVAG